MRGSLILAAAALAFAAPAAMAQSHGGYGGHNVGPSYGNQVRGHGGYGDAYRDRGGGHQQSWRGNGGGYYQGGYGYNNRHDRREERRERRHERQERNQRYGGYGY